MEEKIKEITKKYQKKGESIWWSKDLDVETKDKLTEELHTQHNIEIWKEAQKDKLSFEELKEALLKYNCKDEYRQASIVILRDIFKQKTNEENGKRS